MFLRKHGGAVEFDLFHYGYPDIHELGTARLSWSRLARFLQQLPSDSRTSLSVHGDRARWSDTENLLAIVADALNHLAWMYAGVHAKNPPKKAPPPVPRPGDRVSPENMVTTVNVAEKTQIMGGSLTLAELDAVIARQTGAPRGIAVEV